MQAARALAGVGRQLGGAGERAGGGGVAAAAARVVGGGLEVARDVLVGGGDRGGEVPGAAGRALGARRSASARCAARRSGGVARW